MLRKHLLWLVAVRVLSVDATTNANSAWGFFLTASCPTALKSRTHNDNEEELLKMKKTNVRYGKYENELTGNIVDVGEGEVG